MLIKDLLAQFPRAGRVDWIGIRPARLTAMQDIASGRFSDGIICGDHARPGKRAVTLIQAEHLPVISALCGHKVGPDVVRRNIVVSRINLAALRGRHVRIGDGVILITGPCAPCSRMETALGAGGYNAMRGHGGWCAQVIAPGDFALGDSVHPCDPPAEG